MSEEPERPSMPPDPRGPVPAGTGDAAAQPQRPRGGRGRSAYATRDLTTGSIRGNLWFLAWPATVNGALRMVDQLADLVWAGFFGSLAIAGMGVAQQYNGMVFTARLGLDVGMRAMVSRAIGMGDRRLAEHVVFQAVSITLVYSLLMVLVGVFLTEFLLGLLGVSDGVIAQGAMYMRIQFIGQGAMAFQALAGQSLSAAGDTLTPMRATVLSRVIHLILSPVLMFGLLGMPQMGLPGAALGTIISHAVSLAILVSILFRGTSRLHLRLSDYRLEWSLLRQLLKIGGPASVSAMERSVAQLFMVRLVAPFGDLAVAAFSVTRRFESFAQMGSRGLGQASGIIAGQSLGAGKPERAKETVRWAAAYVALITAVFSGLVIAFPEVFLTLFTRDPAFLDVARTWLVIAAAGFVALSLGQVAQQTFQTAGDTMAVMLITLGMMWGLELPLAWYLTGSTDLGQFGVAWAMLAAMLVRPVIYVPYYYWGHWMRVQVFAESQLASPVE
ncbi:MAG: MATE family efflux transporter, partial [Dehalococcoidia bacterium]